MCKVLKWFSSIDCWLDGWAGILRHLTMSMVFRTNIYSPESRIWSGWSNATHSFQLFMNCDPGAIHHSWVLHHLIIQNNQQHICKLGLALSRLCFSCRKITTINKCWTPSACVLAKKNTALIALYFSFPPGAPRCECQAVAAHRRDGLGQLVLFWGARGPLWREVKLLRLHHTCQILFSVLA